MLTSSPGRSRSRGGPRSRSLGVPKVGPWDGLSSPRRCNPAVKQVHGEAEPVQWEEGRQPARSEENFTRASGGPKRGRPRKEAIDMSHVFLLDAELRPLAPVH